MLLSFLFDIPIFLPLLGAFLFWLDRKMENKYKKHFLLPFSIFTLAIFWIVSGGLYWDLWGEGGNHFMWYSWLDKMGIITEEWVPTPTYLEPWGFWNLFGIFLFLTYPIIMLVFGKICFRFFCWLKGILFGHIKGQSGLWGLFTNK